ncbi:MAG: hypothetical protein ACRDV9_01920 [Acidimicrobiia bacterium]
MSSAKRVAIALEASLETAGTPTSNAKGTSVERAKAGPFSVQSKAPAAATTETDFFMVPLSVRRDDSEFHEG